MKCKSNGVILTSMPPKQRCVECGNLWVYGEEEPECKSLHEIDYDKLGGQIHKILNNTLDRKLTRFEYTELIILIGVLFPR